VVTQRVGFTLVEVLVSAALLGIVMGASYLMFTSGHSAALRGISSCEILSEANQFEQRLGHDLMRMVVTSSSPELIVGLSGTYLSFMVPRMDRYRSVFAKGLNSPITTSSWTVYAEEVRYHLVRDPQFGFHPARNEHVMGAVRLCRWRFRLLTEAGQPTRPTSGPTIIDGQELPEDLGRELELFPNLDGDQRERSPTPTAVTEQENARPPSSSPSIPVTTKGTPDSTPTTSAPYLLCEYVLIDSTRRTTQPRAVVFDLDTARIKSAYSGTFKTPPGMVIVPKRKPLPRDVRRTFDPTWDNDKEAGQ